MYIAKSRTETIGSERKCGDQDDQQHHQPKSQCADNAVEPALGCSHADPEGVVDIPIVEFEQSRADEGTEAGAENVEAPPQEEQQ